jgi:type I restriction enzyme, S subunit
MKYSLDELLQPLQTGKRPKGGVTLFGDVPSFGGENISSDFQTIYENVKKIEIDFYTKLKKGHLKSMDILINKDGANTGKLSIYKNSPFKKAAINEHLFILRSKKNLIDQEYLFYLLQSQKIFHEISLQISGSAQPGLNRNFVKKISSKISSISNQKKIVNTLNLIVLHLSNLNSLIEKLQNLKSSIIKHIFCFGLQNSGKFNKDLNSEIPVSHKVFDLSDKKLGIEIIDGDRGKNYPKNNELNPSGDCLFLTAKNVTKEGFKFDTTQFINLNKDKILGSGKLKENDIVITTRGTVGNLAHYSKNIPFKSIRINSGMAIIRNTKNEIDIEFLLNVLESELVKSQVKKFTYGSAQPQLTIDIINSFKILIPKKNEQIEINQIIKSLNKIISSYKNYYLKIELLKKSIIEEKIN